MVVMTKEKRRAVFKSGYKFLIGGILAVLLCVSVFLAVGLSNYIALGTKAGEMGWTVTSDEDAAGIGVGVIESYSTETEPSETEAVVMVPALSEHDDIKIFTTTVAGDNYYSAKNEKLELYIVPKEREGYKPWILEGIGFEVLGFSRDGWAAIDFRGNRYYVKSSDIIKAEAPEDALEKHVDPVDSQSVRFFTPVDGDMEYVVSLNTRGYSLPDVMSSGNKIDLKEGERAVVVATCGEWYKIIYMNAEYYVLSYLEPRDTYLEKHPDAEITDNTGYEPVAVGAEDASRILEFSEKESED